MKRWNLYLPEELIEKYRVLATKKGVSSAEMARIAMEKYHQAVEKAQVRGNEVQKQASETANAA
jgi:predicted DNA-binding protein